jgi:protein subunit release factor A
MIPASPDHPADLASERLSQQCEFQRTRRSGPGGQHRNKVETAVVVTHLPTGVTAEASERRSQHQNRQVALFRLRVRLALDVRCRRDPEEIPSSRWTSRCRGGRLSVSADHEDFPALLAEALDVLEACELQLRAAAE